jgi:anti-sigma factor RsiW
MNDPQSTLLEDERVREELVSYLDGELDAEASLRVERRLADDPVYRQALQELEKAWDMLDVLPSAQPSENFTQTTVEMVALSAEKDVTQLKSHAERRRRAALLTSAAAVCLASLAGFGAVYWTASRPNRELVRDLPVIENMEYYRHADSVDFLRRLEREGLFDQVVSNAESP